MTQQEGYRSIKGISNSLMSVYEDDFSEFISHWVYNQPLTSKSTSSLTFGSLVDTLLTRPEDYDKMFTTYTGTAPTGQMDAFCRFLAEDMSHEDAYKTVGFKRDKIENVIEKSEKFLKYIDFLKRSKDKYVVSTYDDLRAKKKYEELKNNQYTKNIVNLKESGLISVYNQLELTYFWSGDLRIKGALDRVIVDHLHRTIQPIDFKTSINADSFIDSYVKYRYYRQGSFYMELIRLWANEKGLHGYTILPFKFLICSTSSTRHCVYVMSEKDMEAGKFGGQLHDGRFIKGWFTILQEIQALTKKRDWSATYETQHNGGTIPLQAFK